LANEPKRIIFSGLYPEAIIPTIYDILSFAIISFFC
jgi:hypothetical protein